MWIACFTQGLFDAIPLGIISLFKGLKGSDNQPVILDNSETAVSTTCLPR